MTLDGWLVDHVPGIEPPVRVEHLSGGRSNLTYRLVDAAGARYVLRRPPLATHAGTAHDVLREARILAALAGGDVRVPTVLGTCAEPGVIGAPFFVMAFVDGLVLAQPGDAEAVGPRGRLAHRLAETLAAIHRVDVDGVGLGTLRRPGGYVARQFRRLGRGLDPDSAFHDRVLRVGETLARQAPAESTAGLLHGDFKLGNVLVDGAAGVRAVLDWELASTGDPVADVGWLVASWAQPDDGPWIVPPATAAGGFGSRDDVAQAYAAASGRDLATLGYFVAFAYWRWSCINIGTRRRYLAGGASGTEVDVAALDAQVDWQLGEAERFAGGGR